MRSRNAQSFILFLHSYFSRQCIKNFLIQSGHFYNVHHRNLLNPKRFRVGQMEQDALKYVQNELDRILFTAAPEEKVTMKNNLSEFKKIFGRFLREQNSTIEWSKIQPLDKTSVINYSDVQNCPRDCALLKKLVVVKLNGGLGTTMGCTGPKSIITVRDGLTFLDLTLQQIDYLNNTYDVNVPLVLMNSFNTDEDTEKIIRKYKNLKVDIHTFCQSCHPRINKETVLPVPKSADVKANTDQWYPPGHGDFYVSFQNSGLLSKFLNEGKEYCFISNIDNLAATVDLHIFNLLVNPKDGTKHEFIMEITNKTRADVKGGTLIKYEDKLRLLEIAQVPNQHTDNFKSVKKFKYFNTNNLWMNLNAVQRNLCQNKLDMEIIVNSKKLQNGTNVIQLETAIGAAIKGFENAVGINVPRSRFLPVKKTSDLMLVMSNLYKIQNGSLVMSPERMFPTTPTIKLGDQHFSKVDEFLRRFPAIPDVLELDHLTISGDVTFGKKTSFKGTVIIIANNGDRIDIPSGADIENKIISGNMRILDH